MDLKDATTLPGSGPDDVQQSDVGGGGYMDSLQIEPIPTSSTASVDVILPSVMPQQKRGKPTEYKSDRDVSLGQTTPPYVPNVAAVFGGSLTSSTVMGPTPHVINIAAGEDITKKIMSFSPQYPSSMCILSASGSVSTAILAHPSIPDSNITYEGIFEILSLSGSYVVTDTDCSKNRSGHFSVSLASPDRLVKGGTVAGVLIAASPVQVIVVSFSRDGSKTTNISSNITQEYTTDSDFEDLDHPATPGSIFSNQSRTPNSSLGGSAHMQPASTPMLDPNTSPTGHSETPNLGYF
uniref:AT-hook motif nuclear-localized protein n=1 Tax=Kalanchoe fedtschenkoi TaxID=63787 RepID=A0A7N0URC0_KALFE